MAQQLVFPSPPTAAAGSQRRSRSATARAHQQQQVEPLRVKNFCGAGLPTPEYLRWFASKVKYLELVLFQAHLSNQVAQREGSRIDWAEVCVFMAGKFDFFEKDHPMMMLLQADGDNLRQLYEELSNSDLREEADNLLVHRDYVNASYAKRLSVACNVRAREWQRLENIEGGRLKLQEFKDEFKQAEKEGRAAVDLDKVVKQCSPFLVSYIQQGTHLRYPDVAKAYIFSYLRLAYKKFGYDFPISDDITIKQTVHVPTPSPEDSPLNEETEEAEAQDEPTISDNIPNEDYKTPFQASQKEENVYEGVRTNEGVRTSGGVRTNEGVRTSVAEEDPLTHKTADDPLPEQMEVDEPDRASPSPVHTVVAEVARVAEESPSAVADVVTPAVKEEEPIKTEPMPAEESTPPPGPFSSTEPTGTVGLLESIKSEEPDPKEPVSPGLVSVSPGSVPVSPGLVSVVQRMMESPRRTEPPAPPVLPSSPPSSAAPATPTEPEPTAKVTPSPSLIPVSPSLPKSGAARGVTRKGVAVSHLTPTGPIKKKVATTEKKTPLPPSILLPKTEHVASLDTTKQPEEEKTAGQTLTEPNSVEMAAEKPVKKVEEPLFRPAVERMVEYINLEKGQSNDGTSGPVLGLLLGSMFTEAPTDLVDYNPFKLAIVEPNYKHVVLRPQSIDNLVRTLQRPSGDGAKAVAGSLPLVPLNAVAFNSATGEVTKMGLRMHVYRGCVLRKAAVGVKELSDTAAVTKKIHHLRSKIKHSGDLHTHRSLRSLRSFDLNENEDAIILSDEVSSSQGKGKVTTGRTRQSAPPITVGSGSGSGSGSVEPPAAATVRTRAAKSMAPSTLSKNPRKKP